MAKPNIEELRHFFIIYSKDATKYIMSQCKYPVEILKTIRI